MTGPFSLTIPYYGGATFFFGGPIASDRPIPFTVALDGTEYVVNLKDYQRNSQAALRDGVSTPSGQPDDQLYNNRSAWWRYALSWHHGAGAKIHDLGPDADPLRFDSSVDIYPFERFQASLLPVVGEVKSGTHYSTVTATRGHCYVGDGSASATAYRSADLAAWTAITGLGGTVQALSSDGLDAYVATTTHLYVVHPSSAAASDTGATGRNWNKVHFGANRLLAAADNVLYEVSALGVDSDFITHFQASFRWTAIFNVGSRIYAGGTAGNRSELYSLTTDSSGALVQSAEAAPFGYGETLNDGISHAGIVILCTNKGVRLATIGGDGTLTYGPLIPVGNVTAACAEGRFVWFTMDDHPGGDAGIGRLALDEFVDSLQPAWSPDIWSNGAEADATGVVRFLDHTVWVAGNVLADSDDTYATSGYVRSAPVAFGTVEPKGVTSIFVGFDALATSETVTVAVVDELGESLGSGSVSGDPVLDVTGLTVDLDGTEADRIVVTVTLAGTGSSTPVLRKWRLRGYPVVPTIEEFIVPLVLHSYVVVNDGDGQLRSMDVNAQVDALVARWRTKAPVAFRYGDVTYRVRIEDYELHAEEWLDDSTGFEATMIVKLVTV